MTADWHCLNFPKSDAQGETPFAIHVLAVSGTFPQKLLNGFNLTGATVLHHP